MPRSDHILHRQIAQDERLSRGVADGLFVMQSAILPVTAIMLLCLGIVELPVGRLGVDVQFRESDRMSRVMIRGFGFAVAGSTTLRADVSDFGASVLYRSGRDRWQLWR